MLTIILRNTQNTNCQCASSTENFLKTDPKDAPSKLFKIPQNNH